MFQQKSYNSRNLFLPAPVNSLRRRQLLPATCHPKIRPHINSEYNTIAAIIFTPYITIKYTITINDYIKELP